MLTDDVRHKNIPPALDYTRILKPYHKNYRRKNRGDQYHMR